MDAPVIIFVHVPKTGGKTLHSILSRQLRDVFAESMEEAKSVLESLDRTALGARTRGRTRSLRSP
jgi:hypothetical protein